MDTTSRYDDGPLDSDRATTKAATATTIAAAFAERDEAHDAIHQLHDEGFHDTWLGITSRDVDGYWSITPPGAAAAAAASGATRVESSNWFMRFFGEGDESLHDALVRHGVDEADARAVTELPDRSAVVTVDGLNQPELAARILKQNGGQLITRAFGPPVTGSTNSYGSGSGVSQAPIVRTTSLYEEGIAGDGTAHERTADAVARNEVAPDPAAYDDYGRYRGGTPIDESTRLQLRAERLRVDKAQISGNDATVVTELGDRSVPIVREEVFVERRSARDAAPRNTA